MNAKDGNTLVAFSNRNGSLELALGSKRRVCTTGGRGTPPPKNQLERHPCRIHFSITEKSSSWMRASRRSIRWVFGLAHHAGGSFKVEEQQVILTWNKKNGKIKNITWNKHQISKLVRFREHGLMAGTMECSWRIRTGELVQILVNRSEDVVSERDRYILFVDGENFSSFPTMRELERRGHHESYQEQLQPLNDETPSPQRIHSVRSLDSSACSSELLSDATALALESGVGYRLSMAGLNKFQFSCGEAIEDELRSNLYSPLLDNLRQDITQALPQAEPIVSRAITNAFCADSNSMTSLESLSVYSLEGGCSSALEASALKGAYEWSRSHSEPNEDEKLQFLQTSIDELLLHFRNENLDSGETSRIVLNTAVVLGLDLEENVPNDTVLLHDIPKHFSEQDMVAHLKHHGEITAAAIAPFSSFGFVRFQTVDAANQAVLKPTNDLPKLHFLDQERQHDEQPSYIFDGGLPKVPCRTLKSYPSSTTLDSTEQMSDLE